MKIMLVGGHSSLAQVLRQALISFAEVLTAGRGNCDVELDMCWPSERFILPAGIDTVINLTAHFGGRNFDDMLSVEEVNVLGVLKLAHACSRYGVSQLVQISSIFAGLDEQSSFYGSYSLSKRHSEELVSLYCRNTSLPLVVLRPSQIYGESESFRCHQPFLYEILDRAQRGENITIYGGNDAQRNYIHAVDVAEIIARVVKRRIEGRHDCASLVNVRYSEVAKRSVDVFNSSSAILFDPTKPDIPDNAVVVNKELYEMIDYYPQISLEQGLARIAANRKQLL
jgi:nucleoside-diphosphate-sugar epimerase